MDKNKEEDIFPDEIFDLELLNDPNCNDEQNVPVECLEDLLGKFEGKGIICTPGRWREALSDRIHQKYGDALLHTSHKEGLDVEFMSRSEPEGDSLVSVDIHVLVRGRGRHNYLQPGYFHSPCIRSQSHRLQRRPH